MLEDLRNWLEATYLWNHHAWERIVCGLICVFPEQCSWGGRLWQMANDSCLGSSAQNEAEFSLNVYGRCTVGKFSIFKIVQKIQ